MFSHFKYALTTSFLLLTCLSQGQTRAAGHPFTLYAFVVYAGYLDNGRQVRASYPEIRAYLERFGIKSYNLLYENRLLDYPGGDKTNGIPNNTKLMALALDAIGNPTEPVSLDLEGWKRFDTLRTPRRLIETIQRFKQYNPVSKVGLYAAVPQDTFGYDDSVSRYDKWNKAYQSVANAVDYFSPSLYNYRDTSGTQWKKAAVYNIEACKKYGYPFKKILPYVTPEVKLNGVSVFLSYEQMLFRLKTLYELGADGCLIWTSSGMHDAYGGKPFLDAGSGWLKAVIDFERNLGSTH